MKTRTLQPTRKVFAFTLALTFLLRWTAAHADIVPPPGDCKDKKEGEACKDDQKKDGACGTITSTTKNHATDPPTESQRSYFACKTGVAPTVPTVTNSGKKCSVSIVGSRGESSENPVFITFVGVGALMMLALSRRARMKRV